MKPLYDFLRSTRVQAFGFYIIMLGGMLMIWKGGLDVNDKNRMFDLMFLTATFYYGSSKSGAAKDDTIAALSANQSNPVAKTDSGDINVKG